MHYFPRVGAYSPVRKLDTTPQTRYTRCGFTDSLMQYFYQFTVSEYETKKKGRLDRVVEWRESERKRENDRVGKRWLIEREGKNAFGFLRSPKYFRFVLRAPGAFQNRSSIIVRFSSIHPL